ncbi:LysR family transcriptional regulator [Myceligenerans pegani]|uniref:LysR family transcriptional regulator n=1 Tax=Myceligenerans pegani TaxID=2776917 RepID=A0ABR9N559_9MICO|nr:LysR family transcriptional regulator [Myceligenerans sp. TRM 65318]MBE1878788.1 LysR family transcriptional regulator [Myceligenerans sp. TRM 65318]MBE3021059.1 LysR family transcriptional regulator [Myceligenerans sp. TRM 65318]
MDIHRLQYFVAVADEGGFTPAAHRLRTSQSTVSAGVRALERELGTRLFVRTTRHVELSVAGASALPAARAALRAAAQVRDAARSATGLQGRLRLGVFGASPLVDVPAFAGRFHARYPAVSLIVESSPTGFAGLADDVRSGRLDLAFTGLPVADLEGLRYRELVVDEFVAILPPGHDLEHHEAVGLEDLVRHPFVDNPAGFGNRLVLERELAARALWRDVVVEVPETESVLRFVGAGLGVAALPRSAAGAMPGTSRRPLTERLPFASAVVSRSEPTRLVGAALRLLETSVRPQEAPPSTPTTEPTGTSKYVSG